MARTPSVADAIGFSVPTDIQNHPVRKVDLARQQEMWRSVLFVSILVVGLLMVAWQRSQWTDLGYDSTRLENERAVVEAENHHLRLELDTLRSPQRIEKLATEHLHLVAPPRTEAVVIERVRQVAVPVRTLVARR
jgi:cell division protein FtsL